MTKQRGSTEAIIMAGLAILLAAALGFIFWQNFIKKSDATTHNTGDTSEVTKENETIGEIEEEAVQEGTIIGSLTYPSHGIPSSLIVHASNLVTGDEFTTSDHLSGSRYKYGKGYGLAVPAGNYHVYATVDDAFSEQRAYYTNFVECGFAFGNCENAAERIVVTVEPGKETKDIMVGDWYNPCLVSGGKQPTTKFDLPTC